MNNNIQNGLEFILGRMDTKLDMLLTRSDDHETRLGKLEDESLQRKGVLKTLGIAAGVVGATVSAITNYILGG